MIRGMPDQHSPDQRLAEVRVFKNQATQRISELEKDNKTAELATILKQEWASDPFIEVKEGQKESLPLSTPTFSYSGFISVGSVSLAVIDGKEYALGEELSVPGYILQMITPDHVTILGPGKSFLLTIPFQETSSDKSTSPETKNTIKLPAGALKQLSTTRKQS